MPMPVSNINTGMSTRQSLGGHSQNGIAPASRTKCSISNHFSWVLDGKSILGLAQQVGWGALTCSLPQPKDMLWGTPSSMLCAARIRSHLSIRPGLVTRVSSALGPRVYDSTAFIDKVSINSCVRLEVALPRKLVVRIRDRDETSLILVVWIIELLQAQLQVLRRRAGRGNDCKSRFSGPWNACWFGRQSSVAWLSMSRAFRE